MYNGLVERCFVSCVDSFRRKTLEKNEEQARSTASSEPWRASSARLLWQRHAASERGCTRSARLI
jgi:hypothetical protein